MYYNYVTNYTAISNSTCIGFTVSNVEILVNGDFELGDLTGWSYCSQDNSSNRGGVTANSNNFTYLNFTFFSKSGSHYYVGGSTTFTDYISRTFSTTVNTLYKVSLWVFNSGSGPLTSADLFLGVV
ncbi:unnamed protein product [Rotaria sp. Silwood2]|nr:unnamed protein product [Rotaria sp. Silwood2]CAF4156557.1 unnamed protein product [Rotaria sp. Silwood2]